MGGEFSILVRKRREARREGGRESEGRKEGRSGLGIWYELNVELQG